MQARTTPDPFAEARARRALANKLRAWFQRQARDLPWRRTRDLYAIWVSEIMLQQTQVATVIAYWERFLARFPTVAALAAADEQEVLRLWEGLGYYRRARNLHAAAKKIVGNHGGQFPTTFAQVRELPGIGRYTAGAILSLGLDQRLPILEANTIRVLSRLTAFEGDTSSSAGQRYLWSVAEAILPRRHCGVFNQSLMELGSEVCTVKTPACDHCPVATLCLAHGRQLTEQIPRSTKRKDYQDLTEVAVVIRRRNRVLVRRCQSGERWAGLWDFPRFAVQAGSRQAIAAQMATEMRALVGLDVAAGQHLQTFKHGVTRYRITLHCYSAHVVAKSRGRQPRGAKNDLQWLTSAELDDYPLNSTGRRIARVLNGNLSLKSK